MFERLVRTTIYALAGVGAKTIIEALDRQGAIKNAALDDKARDQLKKFIRKDVARLQKMIANDPTHIIEAEIAAAFKE